MSIKHTQEWFEAAVPNPTKKNKTVQLGCLLEEVVELLNSIELEDNTTEYEELPITPYLESAIENLEIVSNELKRNVLDVHKEYEPSFLDALTDIIVTCVGTSYMNGMDIEGALDEVNASNFSKFENGKPVFDENGKIKKGKNYFKPELEKFV